MDKYPTRSLRKISSAKKKRPNGQTPKKTTVSIDKGTDVKSPGVTHQALSQSDKRIHLTARSYAARCGRNADNWDFSDRGAAHNKALHPQVIAGF